MSRIIRNVMGVAAAGVLTAAIYIMSANTAAESFSGQKATPQIDAFTFMVSAKDLPSERFDAI